jgi:hypothetical protein
MCRKHGSLQHSLSCITKWSTKPVNTLPLKQEASLKSSSHIFESEHSRYTTPGGAVLHCLNHRNRYLSRTAQSGPTTSIPPPQVQKNTKLFKADMISFEFPARSFNPIVALYSAIHSLPRASHTNVTCSGMDGRRGTVSNEFRGKKE